MKSASLEAANHTQPEEAAAVPGRQQAGRDMASQVPIAQEITERTQDRWTDKPQTWERQQDFPRVYVGICKGLLWLRKPVKTAWLESKALQDKRYSDFKALILTFHQTDQSSCATQDDLSLYFVPLHNLFLKGKPKYLGILTVNMEKDSSTSRHW